MYNYDSSSKDWTPVTCLHASDGSSSDKYGASVAIHGTNIVVGSELADGFDYNSGAVYAYTTVPAYVSYFDGSLGTVAISMVTVGAFIFSASIVLWAYKSGKLNSVLEKDCYFGAMGHNPDFDASRRGEVRIIHYIICDTCDTNQQMDTLSICNLMFIMFYVMLYVCSSKWRIATPHTLHPPRGP